MRLALPLFFLLSACAVSPTQQRTISQTLVYAETTATAANETATGLLNSGIIDVKVATQVRQNTNTVFLAVKKAREVLALGDVAGTQAQLNAVTAELDLLQSFLATYKK